MRFEYLTTHWREILVKIYTPEVESPLMSYKK